ncbi:hypothetical protein Ancab_019230 [Ancistrocladus abbreviatus]
MKFWNSLICPRRKQMYNLKRSFPLKSWLQKHIQLSKRQSKLGHDEHESIKKITACKRKEGSGDPPWLLWPCCFCSGCCTEPILTLPQLS